MFIWNRNGHTTIKRLKLLDKRVPRFCGTNISKFTLSYLSSHLRYWKKIFSSPRIVFSKIQWNADLTNHYITKSSIQRVISFNPAKIAITCMEQNLDITDELRFNEILVITNTTQKRKHKIYLEITNKCHYVTER